MNAEDLYMFGGSRVSLNDEVERIRRYVIPLHFSFL